MPEIDAEFIDAKETADLLHIEVGTLANWRSEKRGPPYRKHGRRVVYRRADVLAWSDAQAQVTAP